MNEMTNQRKAEMFDKAMNWIYKQLAYADQFEVSEVLEEIGFSEEEIDQKLTQLFNTEDEEGE